MVQFAITDVLIADYLKRKGYIDTLKALESDLNTTAIRCPVNYEKLEDIISDRVKYLETHDALINERLNSLSVDLGSKFKKWSYPCISKNHEITDLIGKVLVIHLSVTKQFKIQRELKDVLFVTSNDKKTTLIDLEEHKVIHIFQNINKSVGKCCYGIPNTDTFLSCGMDGVLRLFKIEDNKATELTNKQLHKRLITDFRVYEQGNEQYIISIGWDSFLKLHKLTHDNEIVQLSEFKLLSNATALELTFFENKPIFIITRLDSTQLVYFTPFGDDNQLHELIKVSLNDAEFSTHGFTPMSISIDSTVLTANGGGLVAIATSHIPYLRIIITKTPNFNELFQNIQPLSSVEQQLSSPTVRGHILGNYTTNAPQDKFSQSKILWRLNHSGIWIMGDDGVIRGMDLKNGEIVESLDQGHDSRIKNICIADVDGKEVLISSGIDKKLNLWS